MLARIDAMKSQLRALQEITNQLVRDIHAVRKELLEPDQRNLFTDAPS